MNKITTLTALIVLFASCFATPEAIASSRDKSKIGLGIGFVTYAFPSVVGYGVSYNISPRFRAGVNYGTISVASASYNVDISAIDLGFKFFLLDWNFAPYATGGYSILSGTVTGTGSTSGLSLTAATSAPYLGGGLDWQTNLGFNLGFEYKVLLASQSVGAPGLYFGWYF